MHNKTSYIFQNCKYFIYNYYYKNVQSLIKVPTVNIIFLKLKKQIVKF